MWSDPQRREEMRRRITEGIHKSTNQRYLRNKPPEEPKPVYHVPNLEGEVWRDIEGLEGLYAVSNLGRVKSLDRVLPHKMHGTWHIRERLMKLSLTGPGDKDHKYVNATLNAGRGKTVSVRVHRAVAIAFIPNPENKPEVNHIDGNKKNNRASNLEWVTPQENVDHAWSHGLCENVGKKNAHPVVCVETGTVYPSVIAAESAYGLARSAIGHAIKHGHKSAGYHWAYIQKE